MPTDRIKLLINKLWDRFWSGGIANPLTAIEQITYLLFIRMLDEMDLNNEKKSAIRSGNYESIFRGEFKIPGTNEKINKAKLRWSNFRHMVPEELLYHIQNKVFPFIKQLQGKGSLFAKHMSNAVFIIPKASLLTEAIEIIDEIYEQIYIESELEGHSFNDTQGDVYEYLLNELKTSGKNGQFRTKRHIINFIVELIEPKIGDKIADPACGTAGFLLASYQYILTQYTSKHFIISDKDGFKRGIIGDQLTNEKSWNNLKDSFWGYDFDTTMVRIALMNLMLHGIDSPHIDYQDTLSKSFTEMETYDIVMANPPFKGSVDKADINDRLQLTTTKSELLFIELILNMLVKGGKAGVIIPDGVLFGNSNAHKNLRKKLLEENNLQGIISMPGGVFKPYAGVKTAIILFVRGERTKKVWYYDMLSDGYTLDERRTKINDDYPLPEIVQLWKNRHKKVYKEDKKRHFFVDIETLRKNDYDLNINRYKEIFYDYSIPDSPQKIIAEILKLENQILKDTKRINTLLK